MRSSVNWQLSVEHGTAPVSAAFFFSLFIKFTRSTFNSSKCRTWEIWCFIELVTSNGKSAHYRIVQSPENVKTRNIKATTLPLITIEQNNNQFDVVRAVGVDKLKTERQLDQREKERKNDGKSCSMYVSDVKWQCWIKCNTWGLFCCDCMWKLEMTKTRWDKNTHKPNWAACWP